MSPIDTGRPSTYLVDEKVYQTFITCILSSILTGKAISLDLICDWYHHHIVRDCNYPCK